MGFVVESFIFLQVYVSVSDLELAIVSVVFFIIYCWLAMA